MRWRVSLVLCNALTLAMIAARVLGYQRVLAQPGSVRLLAETVGCLLIVMVVIVLMTSRRMAGRGLFRYACAMGSLAAAVQVTHLLPERFLASSRWSGGITLAFMLATFLLWGAIGFRGARTGEGVGFSAMYAGWGAVVTMTFAVCAGVALELFFWPIPEAQMLGWAEFSRSGWNDVHAFAIANTLDSAISHMVIGPVVATVFGSCGNLLGTILRAYRLDRVQIKGR